jgi:hypothetical protein
LKGARRVRVSLRKRRRGEGAPKVRLFRVASIEISGGRENESGFFEIKMASLFPHYEMTNRVLTVMRANVDAGEFDPREYIRVEIKRRHFDNYTAAWLGRREKEVEPGHLSRGYLRSVKIYRNRYLLPCFKARSIRDIHEGLIEDFRDQLPTHLKAKTVYNIMGIRSKMLADAHRRRDIDRLPAFPVTEVPDPESTWGG